MKTMRWSMSCEYIFSSPMVETTEAVAKGNLKMGFWVRGEDQHRTSEDKTLVQSESPPRQRCPIKKDAAVGGLALQRARKKRLRWASQGWLLGALAETLEVLTSSNGSSGKWMVFSRSSCRP